MKRNFRVVTEARYCKETGRKPCHNKSFGYVIQIMPPIVCFKKQDDVEGVGLVRLNPPQRWIQNSACWCKHKATALLRLNAIQHSEYWNRADETP